MISTLSFHCDSYFVFGGIQSSCGFLQNFVADFAARSKPQFFALICILGSTSATAVADGGMLMRYGLRCQIKIKSLLYSLMRITIWWDPSTRNYACATSFFQKNAPAVAICGQFHRPTRDLNLCHTVSETTHDRLSYWPVQFSSVLELPQKNSNVFFFSSSLAAT